MPNCQKCNYNFPPKELRDGYCRDCVDPEILIEEEKIEVKKHEEYQIKIKDQGAVSERNRSSGWTAGRRRRRNRNRIYLPGMKAAYPAPSPQCLTGR